MIVSNDPKDLWISYQENVTAFDMENFVNAKAMMEGISIHPMQDYIVSNAAWNQYIDKALENLVRISEHSEELLTFFGKLHDVSVIDHLIFPHYGMLLYNLGEIEKLRPQYLQQIPKHIKNVLDGLGKGTLSKSDALDSVNDDYILRVKRELVRTKLPQTFGPMDYRKMTRPIPVEVNKTFLLTTLVPFLNTFDKITKKTLIDAANESKNIILRCDAEISSILSAANSIKTANKLTREKQLEFDQVLYNAVRAYSTIGTYFVAMLLQKINCTVYNMTEIYRLYTTLEANHPLKEPLSVCESVVTEIDEIRIENIVNEFLQGNISQLLKVSEQIRGFCGIVGSSDGAESSTINIPEYHDLYRSIKEIRDMFSVFIKCMMRGEIVDTCIESSAISQSLSDKYRNLLKETENNILSTTTPEAIASHMNTVEKYISLISKIARNTAMDINRVKKDLSSKTNPIYGESWKQEELFITVEEFEKNFRNYVYNMISAVINHMKSISEILTSSEEVGIEHPYSGEEFPCDFSEFAYESSCALMEALNECAFTSMIREYVTEREYRNRGVRIVFEAENTNSPTTNQSSNNQNNAQANSQSNTNQNTTTNQNNNTTTNSTSNKTGNNNPNKNESKENIKDAIKKFFDKFMNSLNNLINNDTNRNLKFINTNKEYLLNRNYANVERELYPYKVNPTKMLTDMDALLNAVRNVDQTKLINAKDQDAVIAAVIQPILSIDPKIGFQQSVMNYYQTGDIRNNKTIKFSGDNLKQEVSNMITYCTSYYNTYTKQTQTKANQISQALQDKDNMIIGNNAVPMDKFRWFCDAVERYLGYLTNAMRNRAYDYLRCLDSLNKDNPKNNQDNQNTNENQNQNDTQNNDQK